MPEDYSWITPDIFATKLAEIVENDDLLAIPGVYEIVSEHYNNEVLEALGPKETDDDHSQD